MRKASRKREGEPLTSEDWEAYYRLMSGRSGRLWLGLLRSLPSSLRCGICGAPFAGFGSRLIKPLGYRPSRKNPTFCDTCIEASPPGEPFVEVGIGLDYGEAFVGNVGERSLYDFTAIGDVSTSRRACRARRRAGRSSLPGG